MKSLKARTKPVRMLGHRELSQVIGGSDAGTAAIKDHVDNPSNTPLKD